MAHEHLASHTADHVRTLTLQRPAKKNAFTLAMYDALTAELQEADSNAAVRVVLLEGAGKCFTAGNDLSDFMGAAASLSPSDAPQIKLLLQLVRQKKPLVVAVEGPAIGIGTTLLLHADFVVASATARFQMPFVNLGLCPEGGSSVLLAQAVGMARAAEWLMFGDPFGAEEALQAGLINRVVAPDALQKVSQERARALAAKPPEAMMLTKKLLREPQHDTPDAIKREAEHFFARLKSPEAAEAFAAFFQRRS